MRLINWLSASVFGIIIAVLVSGFPYVWPAFVIGTGAVAVTVPMLLRRGGRKYYTATGTAYCLGLAAVIQTTTLAPSGYAESPYAALLSLGLVSGIIVVLQISGRQVVKKLFGKTAGEKYATSLYDMVAAIAGLLGMIWTVLTAYEKAIRYGGITIGGTIGFALNLLGIELPIPWIIQDGVDAAMILFVGCTLIAFHTLESLHTTWHATKETSKAGVSAGMKAGKKASAVAGEKRNQFKGKN